ncbi:MAG: hypothetical protein MZV64_37840 [Ignavibacteriales bacterium]|nr:hypothetical protein [Ignavibacteriales bacterium]
MKWQIFLLMVKRKLSILKEDEQDANEEYFASKTTPFEKVPLIVLINHGVQQVRVKLFPVQFKIGIED